jgi:hypothetical protein
MHRFRGALQGGRGGDLEANLRRWIAASLFFFTLLGAGAGTLYAWCRHEDSVERAVRRNLGRVGVSAHWVSCTEDHDARIGSAVVIFYRCYPHGGQEDGVEVCSPFIGGRPLTEAEARHISIETGACRNQG